MKLLSDRNWYTPRSLRWLPDLRVEGNLTPIALRRTERTPGTPAVAEPLSASTNASAQAYE